MKLHQKIMRQFCYMILLLWAVSVLAFLLINFAPIDPLVAYIGPESSLSMTARQKIIDYWGLDQPLWQRYWHWLSNLFHGYWGESIAFKRPVLDIIKVRFSYSIVLMLVAWSLSGIVGFILGIITGLYEGSLVDRCLKTFCLILKSAPTFWLGLLFLTVFAIKLGWFPLGMAVPLGKLASEVTFADRVHHLVLPALTLTVVGLADILLYTRQKLIEILRSDFILYAQTRGESTGQLMRRHLLRNVALPAITVQFTMFSELFGGMALAENVFSCPGIGSAATVAVLKADVPLLLGITVVSALFVAVGNLCADILYGVLDPRIRMGVEL